MTEQITQQVQVFYDRLMKDYDVNNNHSGIDGERVAKRLTAIAELGMTEEGGCRRISFSQEEKRAKELVKQWMEEDGLAVTVDGAGNVFGRVEGQVDGPAVMSGSHLDSVMHGGHFDGPLGVISALEVASAWKNTDEKPSIPFEVVVFTDEEGARFNGGLLGSQSVVGELDLEEEKRRVDFNGKPFEDVLAKVGLTPEGFIKAERDLSQVKAFVEVHIEQGKQLEKRNQPVGVVTGIAGPTWLKVTFKGIAGHAGNTPMNDRTDALVAASEFVTNVKDFPVQVSDSGVATVGKLEVEPNGVNVIPGEVTLTVDIRDIKEEWKSEITRRVKEYAQTVSEQHGTAVEVEESMNVSPVQVPEKMQKQAGEAVEEALGLDPFYLPSGAGHDAMILGRYVPMAMLFTQSLDGVSHNPKEWSSLNDCVQTIHVLKRFVEKIGEES
ncbi:M20 family metallo-hydrolase [Alkalibacillus haloalkaliphilus]|uniref:M20 family metallo-hydrolase n=1 Tax=Alkalibacillus haloalkaliphilus TaxID=94136 RepID=UPI002936979C|nr:M20 family metallo-hydrolase [Alkalibacillus haloalkaliphilus]MDV2581335.1 M20 family metallo-hydrolase [Alkalibacillus haloalkaliphilus]